MLPNLILQRSFHTSFINLVRLRRTNPGVMHQLKALQEDGAQFKDDPEDFGDFESDFMEVHKSHRQHEKELNQQREKVRLAMIKQKYFRPMKLPNMLTYAEKEQIRLLHSRDPNEWSIERLTESFPATEDIVQKVLEARWKPRDAKRVRQHDEAVIRNWEKYRAGDKDLNLPPDLEEHLKKFTVRRKEDLEIPAENWPLRPELPKPKTKEFLSLITSCDKYADRTDERKLIKAGNNPLTEQTKTNVPLEHPDNETYLLEKVVDKRKMRLKELKQLKLSPAELEAALVRTPEKEEEALETEQEATGALQNPFRTNEIAEKEANSLAQRSPSNDLNYVQKFEDSEIEISVEDQKRFEITRVKDRIHIPRRLWRKGATYRVEDCYYDDDGELLYRVPGMTR